MSRSEIHEALKMFPYGVYISDLQKHFKIKPDSESDRPNIWRLGQTLAELVRSGFAEMDTTARGRFFIPVGN